MVDRSSVFVLSDLISACEGHLNLPDDIKHILMELSELCDEYLGSGFTYLVHTDENGNIEHQFINVF